MAPVPRDDRHAGQFGLLSPHSNILLVLPRRNCLHFCPAFFTPVQLLSQRDSLKLVAAEQCTSSVPFMLITPSFFTSPFTGLLSLFLCVQEEFFWDTVSFISNPWVQRPEFVWTQSQGLGSTRQGILLRSGSEWSWEPGWGQKWTQESPGLNTVDWEWEAGTPGCLVLEVMLLLPLCESTWSRAWHQVLKCSCIIIMGKWDPGTLLFELYVVGELLAAWILIIASPKELKNDMLPLRM